MELVDVQGEGFDAAIRFGKGQYSNVTAVKLFDETITPMCSPHLLDKHPSLHSPKDLANFKLIHNDSLSYDTNAPTWETWFNEAGEENIDSTTGIRFSQPDHALQAAVDGLGVTLGWEKLATDDLISGRLIAPFDLSFSTGSAFYLVYPESFGSRKKIQAFQSWLLAKIND